MTSTRLFTMRNLAASWPAFALCLAALLTAAGPRLRLATAGLVIVAFAIGARTLLNDQYHRPNFQAAADFVDRHATSHDVVLDETKPFSAGPLSPLDIALHRPHRVFRGGAISNVVSAANGGRIFVVGSTYAPLDTRAAAVLEHAQRAGATSSPFPGYSLVASRAYPGSFGVVLSEYADRTSPQG